MLPQHLQLPSNPYLVEEIRTMRKQESTAYKVSRDYFHDAAGECMSSGCFRVSSLERKTMLTWAYKIVDVCKVERHVAITAVTFLDRYLADNIGRCAEVLSGRLNFQLCFIACFIIALKNCAGMKVESEFVTNVLCHGLYPEEDILNMEMDVLQGLGWRLNGPTAIDFVHAFLQLLPNRDDYKMKTLIKTAEVQVELAMADFSFAMQDPSSIAYSSIVLSMDSLGRKYYGGVDVHSMDRFVWTQSVAMTAGLAVEGWTIRLLCNRLVRSIDSDACDISDTSSQGPSPRTSICEFYLNDVSGSGTVSCCSSHRQD